jgi:hypothetical protein
MARPGYSQDTGKCYNTPSHSGSDYRINRLSNGGFEVVWPQKYCIATFKGRER